MSESQPKKWSTSFLLPPTDQRKRALIILNQSFPRALLDRAWKATDWHICADGGANRLHDLLLAGDDNRQQYLPDLIKGDLDSLRDDVRQYYAEKGVTVVEDGDQYSTDLMKCIFSLAEKEKQEGQVQPTEVILLGGFSGRLDQTVHVLSYVHKLRKSKRQVYVVTADNVAWVLDEGQHYIDVDHTLVGPTCGLLPLGVNSTTLSFTGLRWNLTDFESGFDGSISTSNHFVPEEKTVWIKTTKPIWWTAELRPLD